MGKKHKHEEHVNHERWVISYADMVTLLFALFVVLYALGEVKLKKLKELKKSLAFAFHFEGHGQTFKDGLHDRGDVGGALPDAALLLAPQQAPLKEFLLQTLPAEFEEITGRSVETELQDDSIRFSGPLSAYFTHNSKRIKPDVQEWLAKLVENANIVAAQIRIHISAPKLRISRRPDSTPYFSGHLCLDRLHHLQELVSLMSAVMHDQVTMQLDYTDETASRESWEDVAIISFFFSNTGR